MISTIIRILVNTGAFYGISKLLPGFKVKDEKTALTVAVAFSILGAIAGLLISPLVGIVIIFLSLFAFIPIIGPLIAGAGILATTFIVFFTLSVVLLVAVDKLMDDFEMDSISTAALAALLLGLINIGAHLVLPGI